MPRTPNAHRPAAIRPAPKRDQPGRSRYVTLCSLLLEVDLRRRLRRGGRFVIGVFLEAEDLRGHVARESPAGRVVFLDPLVVAAARNREPILGTGELVHQPVELLV